MFCQLTSLITLARAISIGKVASQGDKHGPSPHNDIQVYTPESKRWRYRLDIFPLSPGLALDSLVPATWLGTCLAEGWISIAV